MLKYCILSFFYCLMAVVNAKAQAVTAYLKSNSTDVTQNISPGLVLGDDFFKHQVFLLGESHGVQQPQDIDFNFLKLLNQKAGVRTYVAEVDFAKAWYLNQYLDHGNDKYLDTVFADWVKQDAQWANKDFQQKIRKIRALNQTLDPKKQIHFTGIDQIQNPVLAADYFDALFTKKPYAVYQKRFSQLSILLRSGGSDSLIVNEAKQLLISLQSGEFSKLNEEGSRRLSFALSNCTKINAKSRERVLYENFKTCYQDLNWKNEKLYGFWGFFHILQAKANEGKSASFVNQVINDPDLALKNKVISIGFLYVGSQMALPTQFLPPMMQAKGKHYTIVGQMNYDGPLTKFDFIEDFKQASRPNTVTLFRIDKTGSPFKEQAVHITYSNMMPAEQRLQLDEPGKQMADYFQYVILVRNSAAVNTIRP